MKIKIKNNNWLHIFLFCLIAFIIFLFLRDKLLFTPDFGESDAYHSELPGMYYLWESLNQNTLPFWSNNVQGGYPIFSIPGYGGLYLLNIIVLKLFPFVIGYNLLFIFTFLITTLGFYFLLKEFKVSSLLSFLISLSFSVNGALSLRLVHLAVIETFSLVPFLFFVAIRYINTKHKIYLFFTPIIIAQMFLAGFVQVIFNSLLGLFLFLFFYLRFKNNNFKAILKSISLFIVLVFIGIIYALPQLLPSFDLNHFAARNLKLDYFTIVSFPFNPQNIINFVLPYFFGNPKYATYPPYSSDWGIFWENTPYIGIIFALLSIISFIVFLFKFKKKKYKKFILFNFLIIFLLLLLALGKNSPLYLIFNLFPFNLFRTQARFLIILNFFIFFTSAILLNFIFQKSHSIIKLIILIFLAVNFLDLLLFAKNYHLLLPAAKVLKPPKIAQQIDKRYRYLTFGQIDEWNDVFIKSGWSKKEDINNYLFFKNFMYTNSNLLFDQNLFDIYTGYGYKLKRPDYITSLILNSLATDKSYLLQENVKKMLALNNIKYLIIPTNIESPELEIVDKLESRDKKIYLYQLSDKKLNYAYFYSPEKLKKISYLEEFNVLYTKNHDFIKEAVIENENLSGKISGKLNFKINKQIIQNNLIKIEATMDNNGYLVIKNNYYPEWELYINDKKQSIYKTNLIHMGFFIQKGKNTIELRYGNKAFKEGLIVAIVVFIVYSFIIARSSRLRSNDKTLYSSTKRRNV